MVFHVGLEKPGELVEVVRFPNIALADHNPNWRACIVEDEAELIVCGFDPYVFDVAAS